MQFLGYRRPDGSVGVRNLVALSQDCVDAYNRREEVILATQA